jgi:hypothetical protein
LFSNRNPQHSFQRKSSVIFLSTLSHSISSDRTIAAATSRHGGVEWLSVGAPGQSGNGAEAWRVGVEEMTRSHGGDGEARRVGDPEARLVGVAAVTWRRGRWESWWRRGGSEVRQIGGVATTWRRGGVLEVRLVWTPAGQ